MQRTLTPVVMQSDNSEPIHTTLLLKGENYVGISDSSIPQTKVPLAGFPAHSLAVGSHETSSYQCQFRDRKVSLAA